MVSFSKDAPIDLPGFRGLMKQAGIEEVVDLTLDIFVGEAPKLFGELSSAAESGDLEVVRANAHSLKSSCGNIWANRLSGYFETMETAAADLDSAAVESALADARPEFDRVIEYIGEVRGNS